MPTHSPYSGTVPEKLTVVKIVKKSSTIYGTRRCVSTLRQMNPIHPKWTLIFDIRDSSGWQDRNNFRILDRSSCYLLHAGFFLGLFLEPEDAGDMFLQNTADFQLTTRRYLPEDRTLHTHRCENLKPYIL
jgi:hypothetical protein